VTGSTGSRVGPVERPDPLELGDKHATLTPREAQRFAFYLARAYARAAGTTTSRAGNTILNLERIAR
jgi:hypothetical protein